MIEEKEYPLVSVVTPVYNGEKYLDECIQSVLNQTYSNWEYIIVNNCSTDRSFEIACHYAEQDKRIKVFNNNEFLKQLPNWNHAIKKISPESQYCKLLQADDWMFPECLERKVSLAQSNPSIGVISSYRLIEKKPTNGGLPYIKNQYTGREIGRLFFLKNIFLFGSSTTVLFRSDLIKKKEKFFNEDIVHADSFACFDILRESDFGFVHQVLTFTRRHNESTTSFCNYYDTFSISNFQYLKHFGKYYLNPSEYKSVYRRMIRVHHRSLARIMIELRGRTVWDYHKEELHKIGYNIEFVTFFKLLLYEMYYLRRNIKLLFNSLNRNKNTDTYSHIENRRINTV